jgi:hypothetical protein
MPYQRLFPQQDKVQAPRDRDPFAPRPFAEQPVPAFGRTVPGLVQGTPNELVQRGNKPGGDAQSKAEAAAKLKAEMDKILSANPQIVVAPHYNIYNKENLSVLRRYVEGTLVLYRASQQWYYTFPQDAGYLELKPKGPLDPATDPLPDFEANQTNWIPFTDDRQYAINISLSVSATLRQYWRDGRIDTAKPMVIVQSIRVDPREPLAFGLDGEYQLKHEHRADNVLTINVDADLGDYNFGLVGQTFREWLGPVDAGYNAVYYRALASGDRLPKVNDKGTEDVDDWVD